MNTETHMNAYIDGDDVILEFTADENSGRYAWEESDEAQSPVYLLNQEQMDAIESALSGMAAMIRAHEWNVDDSLPIDKVASEVAIDLYKPRLFEARTIVLDLLRNPI